MENIPNTQTRFGDFDKVHDAFDIEKKVVATIKAEEINEIVSDCPKILRLTNKKQ